MSEKEEFCHFVTTIVDPDKEYVYSYPKWATNPSLLQYYKPRAEILFEVILRIIDLDEPLLMENLIKCPDWNDLSFEEFVVIGKRIKSRTMLERIMKSIDDAVTDINEQNACRELFPFLFDKVELPKHLLKSSGWSNYGFAMLELSLIKGEDDEKVKELIHEDCMSTWEELVKLMQRYGRIMILAEWVDDICSEVDDVPVELSDLYYKPPNGTGWLEQLENLEIEQKNYNEYVNKSV